MSEPNTPSNQLSESESFSTGENAQKTDSSQPNLDVSKSTAQNLNKTHNKPSQELLKNTDWYAIACKIRKNNRQLVQKILELETSLQKSVDKVEVQQRRCRSADNLIEQQTQELNNSQQEIGQLYSELEKVNHQSQNQQILMENLSQQLRTSQEQIARLERECSGLQDSYHQEKQKSLELEKQNRELEVRLQRQQHYTLQFKAALDQCLKAPSDQNGEEILASKVDLKAGEIKPWSNDQEKSPQININSHLHKKLLATQTIDQGESLSSDFTPTEIEINREEINNNIINNQEKNSLDQLETNDFLSKESDLIDPELAEEENSDQIDSESHLNLPLEDKQEQNEPDLTQKDPKSTESESNSIFLDITEPSPKNKKKGSLKLPKF